jgi:glycosyltransferase involved in cell wall biosynthesis/GT2 family glycosyltransferase
MSTDFPGISILIPSYNGMAMLRKCLPPLIAETAAYPGKTEIIVVDDGGADETHLLVPEEFPGVRAVRNDANRGFSRSINAGAARAGFPLILLLNNDIEITRPLLAPLAALFSDKSVFAVQPRMISGLSDESAEYLNRFISKPGFLVYRYERAADRPSGPIEMDFVSGGCCMIDKSKFIALGMFDETFSPVYFEDIDLCFRAKFFGWKMLYHPGIRVYHRQPASTVDASYSRARKNAVHKTNYFRFLIKNAAWFRHAWLAWLTIPVYAVLKSLGGNPAFLTGFCTALADRIIFRRVSRPGNRVVLYLDTPIPPPGGGQKSLLGIIAHLKSYTPFIVSSLDSELSRFAKENGIPSIVHRVSKPGALFSLLKSRRLVRMINPAIIHCNSAATFYTMIFALAAALLRVPFIWHVRVIRSAGWKESVIASLAGRIIVISDAVGAKYREYRTSRRIVKIQNAVDTAVFRPAIDTADVRREFSIPGACITVGVFSRLEGWKGHRLFFDAARILLDGNPGMDFRFLIVGDGPDAASIRESCRDRGIEGKTVFTGLRHDVPGLMTACDIIVNPSTQPEPFGRTVIEAMACGRTVIATDMGGHREIIRHGVDGFLVPADALGLAALIMKAAVDPALRARIGDEARKKVLAEFTVERQIERLERLYASLIG